MWRIVAFIPAASLLLLLAWIILARRTEPSRKHLAYLAIALGVLAWLSIVLPMHIPSINSGNYQFVAQRDIGYYGGSIAVLSTLFLVVALLSLAARRFNLGTVAASVSALVLATAGSLFIPGLFAAGWVIGCVFTGYPSCM